MSGRPRTARIRTDGRLGSTPDTDYCTSFRHRPHDGVQSYRYIGTVISMSAQYRSILLPRVLDVEMSAGGRVSRLESSDINRSTEPLGRPDAPTRCDHLLQAEQVECLGVVRKSKISVIGEGRSPSDHANGLRP